MNKKFSRFKMMLAVAVLIEILLLIVLRILFQTGLLLPMILVVVNAVMIYYVLYQYQEDTTNRAYKISDLLGTEAAAAFLAGEIGILTYDDDYVITWMSELFNERGINRISKKLLLWLPEVNDLFQGEREKVNVRIDDRWYEITRKDEAQILFFVDVTTSMELRKACDENQVVVGMIHLDNYNETTQYADEQETSQINTRVRQPIVDWCKENGILMKRMRSDRFFIVLNEAIFEKLAANRFSIVRDTRRTSADMDISITLSMVFARGTNEFAELDEMVNSLMELAQTRGGDQVVIKKKGEDVKFYGGGSEAQEKRSRVRVRIMANTLRELILKSSIVIICGHREADFDCIGSAMCMSRIVQAYNRQCCIISKTGGIEAKLNAALKENDEHLKERHRFVTESEALNQLRDETLVIMVDHHKPQTSNGTFVLEKAKKVAIFDHHRRSADLSVDPILIYIEAGASSSCELVAEFVPYLSSHIEVDDVEATIMYAGMLIDTQRFKTRTGVRTFDAASMIRKWGADPILADQYLKDDYYTFDMKNTITKYCERRENGVIIAAVAESESASRSVMSMAADQILNVQDVEAVFVIARTIGGQYAISSRSTGNINVQVIMERMNGGGHFTAAALQREHSSVQELRSELIKTLDEYFKEVKENESHHVG